MHHRIAPVTTRAPCTDLRFDVSVADSDGVDVVDGAQQLPHVAAHEESRHQSAGLGVVAQSAVQRRRNEVHHEVEVELVAAAAALRRVATVETVTKRNHVRVVDCRQGRQQATQGRSRATVSDRVSCNR